MDNQAPPDKEEATRVQYVEDVLPHDEEQEDPNYRVGFKSFCAITALALGNCCAALSNSSNTTIRFQVAEVGGANLASWIGNSSFLLTLCFGPIFGFLGDRLGKKWFMVGGAGVGVVGGCIAGSAHSVQRIIAGQALSGFANAGCIVSIAASQEITPNKMRPTVMGYTQTLASIAALLGTYCAGAFVKYESWRWSYYLNACAYFIAGTSIAIAYWPPPPLLRRQWGLKKIYATVDWVGILLLSGSLAALIIALTWGGVSYPWHSGAVLGSLIAGCAGLVILGCYEWLVKKDGLLDHRLFANRNFPILLLVCTIDGMLLLGVNVLFSQEIATLFTTDSVRIAVILSPYLITSLFGCLPAGYLMSRTKSYRTLLVSALIWCSLFLGLMALITPSRLDWAYAFSTLFGLGTAVTTTIPVVALGLSVPSYLLGAAGTLSISCRALGGIIGITIFTAIYNNKVATNLPHEVAGALQSTTQSSGGQLKALLGQVLGALSDQAVPPPVALQQVHPALSQSTIDAVLGASSKAQSESWKWVWVALSAIVAFNAIIACVAKPVDTNMSHHVESALERSEERDRQMSVKA